MQEEFEVVDVTAAGMSLDDYPTADPEWASQQEREDAIGDGLVFTEGPTALEMLDKLIEDMSRGATAWPHRIAEIRDAVARESA